MGEFEEYASIVTNSTNLLKSRSCARGQNVERLPLAEYLPLNPRGHSGFFLPLPRILSYIRAFAVGELSFTGRGPSTSRLCRAGHWIQRHGKAILPWKGPELFMWPRGRRNPPDVRIDARRRERPSDICTYESSLLHRINFGDLFNQGERHSRWMGLLIATRRLTTLTSRQFGTNWSIIVDWRQNTTCWIYTYHSSSTKSG